MCTSRPVVNPSMRFGSWRSTLVGAIRLLVGLAVVLNLSTGSSVAAISATQIAAGVTAPRSGLILAGTAIHPVTGQPFRHIWYGDLANGLCRLDPDLDTPGPRTLNPATCVHLIANFAQFKPGQLAFDPATNTIYAVDLQTRTQGIIRMHFLPGGDSGHGMLDLLHQEVLGGFNSGCGLPGNVPNSAVLGPDGNLYVAFKQSGNILRVVSPASDPLPCTNVRLIGATADGRRDFGLAWVGHDLFGGDGQSPWVITNADQCLTPANGRLTCRGVAILGGLVTLPSAVASNQVYPQLNGSQLYFANPNSVSVFQVKPNQQLLQDYATGFQFISGLIVDTARPGNNEVLYIGDDPANGLNPNQGRWWRVGSGPASVAPTTPAAPTGVTATAGNAQASVSWTAPASNGFSPITGYTVTSSPPGAAASVSAATTTVLLTGLSNGASYSFTVTALNAGGSSAPSAPSNSVTLTAPPAIGATPVNVPATPASNSTSATANAGSATVVGPAPSAPPVVAAPAAPPPASGSLPDPAPTSTDAPMSSTPTLAPVGSDSVASTPTAADPESSTTEASSPEDLTTSVVVDPSTGGLVSSSDAALIVTIPADAADWLTVSLTELSPASQDAANLQVGSRRYVLSVQDSTGADVSVFSPPLELSVQPDMTSLQAGSLDAAVVMALDPDSGAFDILATTVQGTQLQTSLDSLGPAPRLATSPDV